ncbi:hypothetical protein U1Q18_050652 [Sarracenia purpurea var. burkii]
MEKGERKRGEGEEEEGRSATPERRKRDEREERRSEIKGRKRVSQALVSNRKSSSIPLHADNYAVVEYYLHWRTTESHPWCPNFQLKITQVVFTPGLTPSSVLSIISIIFFSISICSQIGFFYCSIRIIKL